jgi:hypothetical protein
MDYGEVLSRAWQIIWKHKVLWIFGILVSCTSANNGSGFPGANSSWQTSQSQFDSTINQIPDWQIIMFIGLVMLVVLFFVLLAIFLGTIGKIGLIRGTIQADQDAEKLSFGELFSGSLPYFWRVFLLNLVVCLAMAVAVFALILTICLAPLACLMIPVAWVVGVVVEQASVAIVAEDLGIMDGLKRGWEVVRLNPGPMLVMWLILVLAIGFLGGMIIAIPMMFTFGPIIAGIIGGLLAEGFWPVIGGFAFAALCFVAYLPFLIVLGGILRTYIGSAWTLTFLRLTAAEAPIEGEPLEPLPESL